MRIEVLLQLLSDNSHNIKQTSPNTKYNGKQAYSFSSLFILDVAT